MRKLLKKAMLIAIVSLETVMLSGAPVLAKGININKELGRAEKRYHIDQTAVQNIGENINVSGNKGYAPEVRVLFSPQDPQPGKKITARAFAQFFTNTSDALYYTWYLKRAKCVNAEKSLVEINGTVEKSGEEGCDYDGDGFYTINDMKIEAARIIAGNGFDIRYNDQTGGNDDDNDGYVAFPGGDSKRSATETSNPYYYYIHDFNSGLSYEIVDDFAQADIYPSCAGEDEVAVCVANRTLQCPAKQITKVVDRDRPLDIKTEGGTGTGGTGTGGGGDTPGTGTGGTGTGGTAEGKQKSTTIVSTNINQSENQFDICTVVGVPTCKSKLEQLGANELLERGAGAFGGAGTLFAEVEGGGTPECDEGETPVCVKKDVLRYSVEELKQRSGNLNTTPEWEYIAQAYATGANPKTEGYVIEPNGKFTNFQCTDSDIEALVSFWPPPKVPAASETETYTAAELDKSPDNAVSIFSEAYVLDGYYSCEAELYGLTQWKVASTGKDILDEGDIIETCNPQEITADSFQRFHLFPRNAEGEQVGESAQNGGDEGFGMEDELFYYTDPFDKDTADNLVNDEATIVGLGQDTFSWIYTPGDEVGVIVEGTSMMPTKHPDSSNMIMFATVNNACDYAGMVNNSIVSNTGKYQLKIRGQDVKIPAISFTDPDGPEEAFNACLSSSKNAFVSPAQGGAAKKLEIDLSVTPENPINDPVNSLSADGGGTHINMGDTVKVSAVITNAKYKSDRLRYTWSLWKSNDGTADFDPDNWTIIAGKVGDTNLGRNEFDFPEAEITPLIGNGLSEISFKMNLKNEKIFNDDADFTYLRARVFIEESFDLLAQELHEYDVSRGRADVIFRVSRASNKMRAYSITNANQVAAGVTGDDMNTEAILICEDEPGQLAKCPVVKNQLLKLVLDNSKGGVAQYTDYRWKVNNKPLYKPTGFKCFADDDDVQESVCNFLPITGESGTEYTVTVLANDVGRGDGGTYGSGKAVEVTRKFIVVDPYVAFCDDRKVAEDGSTGAAQCSGVRKKPVSTYVSDTEVAQKYSERVLLAEPHSSPTIHGAVRPRWIVDDTKINWFMEGVYQNSTGNTFTVDGTDKNPTESTNVIAKAVYQPKKSVVQLMRDTWNFTDRQLMPLHFESPVQIEYVEGAAVTISAPAAFFAALSVNAPGTVLFLFRVFIAVGIAVFLVGLLWRFVPDRVSRPRL